MYMKAIILVFVKIFHLIFNYTAVQYIKKIIQFFYYKWISFEFKKIGEQSFICKDLFLAGGQYIEIGKNTTISKHAILTAWDKYKNDCFNPQIIIGNNVSIGEYCHITAINKIIIGDGVLTGRWITITDNSHGKTTEEDFLLPPIERNLYSPGPVIIEDNVWIGDKVTILPNVRIGKNSVIGANSVVNKDIPANCVAAGNPARVVKIIN
jgi:acetyltransferase-like isoleucine patch superfamily enzyme